MQPDSSTFLITGTTGFLGKLVLEVLLRRREDLGVRRIFVIVRRQGISAEARFQRTVEQSPCLAHLPPDWRSHVNVIEGDLSEPRCGLDDETAARLEGCVTHVIHSAAAVDFNLPLEEATASNVTAALNVVDLAKRCVKLKRLVSVSTAYVTPHPGENVPIEEELATLEGCPKELYDTIRDGRARESELLPRSGHPNTYTFTKNLSEHLVLERARGLPLVLVRPSIISATWRTPFPGWIDSPAAFAAFVALVGSGYMRAIVGNPETRLNLVPADWVAEQLVAASFAPLPDRDPPVRHAVADRHHNPSLAECREVLLDYYRSNPVGRAAKVRYLGPAGVRFRLADLVHNRVPVRLAMLASAKARKRGPQLLSRIALMNRIFPYFTQRTFAFRSSHFFDESRFDRREYLSVVAEGVSRHLLQRPR
jgi:thioester reductase-like protein